MSRLLGFTELRVIELRTALCAMTVGVLTGGPAPVAADRDDELPERPGPTASVSLGGGYSGADGQGGGFAVIGELDVGWFITDRFALLVGATGLIRPEASAIYHSVWHLGVEYWMASRWYLRGSIGSSHLGREAGTSDSDDSIQTLGIGEGALLALGVPVWSWRWVALDFQVMTGGGFHHGDGAEARYTAFAAAGFELALR